MQARMFSLASTKSSSAAMPSTLQAAQQSAHRVQGAGAPPPAQQHVRGPRTHHAAAAQTPSLWWTLWKPLSVVFWFFVGEGCGEKVAEHRGWTFQVVGLLFTHLTNATWSDMPSSLFPGRAGLVLSLLLGLGAAVVFPLWVWLTSIVWSAYNIAGGCVEGWGQLCGCAGARRRTASAVSGKHIGKAPPPVPAAAAAAAAKEPEPGNSGQPLPPQQQKAQEIHQWLAAQWGGTAAAAVARGQAPGSSVQMSAAEVRACLVEVFGQDVVTSLSASHNAVDGGGRADGLLTPFFSLYRVPAAADTTPSQRALSKRSRRGQQQAFFTRPPSQEQLGSSAPSAVISSMGRSSFRNRSVVSIAFDMLCLVHPLTASPTLWLPRRSAFLGSGASSGIDDDPSDDEPLLEAVPEEMPLVGAPMSATGVELRPSDTADAGDGGTAAAADSDADLGEGAQLGHERAAGLTSPSRPLVLGAAERSALMQKMAAFAERMESTLASMRDQVSTVGRQREGLGRLAEPPKEDFGV